MSGTQPNTQTNQTPQQGGQSDSHNLPDSSSSKKEIELREEKEDNKISSKSNSAGNSGEKKKKKKGSKHGTNVQRVPREQWTKEHYQKRYAKEGKKENTLKAKTPPQKRKSFGNTPSHKSGVGKSETGYMPTIRLVRIPNTGAGPSQPSTQIYIKLKDINPRIQVSPSERFNPQRSYQVLNIAGFCYHSLKQIVKEEQQLTNPLQAGQNIILYYIQTLTAAHWSILKSASYTTTLNVVRNEEFLNTPITVKGSLVPYLNALMPYQDHIILNLDSISYYISKLIKKAEGLVGSTQKIVITKDQEQAIRSCATFEEDRNPLFRDLRAVFNQQQIYTCMDSTSFKQSALAYLRPYTYVTHINKVYADLVPLYSLQSSTQGLFFLYEPCVRNPLYALEVSGAFFSCNYVPEEPYLTHIREVNSSYLSHRGVHNRIMLPDCPEYLHAPLLQETRQVVYREDQIEPEISEISEASEVTEIAYKSITKQDLYVDRQSSSGRTIYLLSGPYYIQTYEYGDVSSYLLCLPESDKAVFENNKKKYYVLKNQYLGMFGVTPKLITPTFIEKSIPNIQMPYRSWISIIPQVVQVPQSQQGFNDFFLMDEGEIDPYTYDQFNKDDNSFYSELNLGRKEIQQRHKQKKKEQTQFTTKQHQSQESQVIQDKEGSHQESTSVLDDETHQSSSEAQTSEEKSGHKPEGKEEEQQPLSNIQEVPAPQGLPRDKIAPPSQGEGSKS